MDRTSWLAIPFSVAFLSACSSSYESSQYMISRYGGTVYERAKVVTSACGRTYRVARYENMILTDTYRLSGLTASSCGADTSDHPVVGSIRYSAAAVAYIKADTGPRCEIVAGRELTKQHSEFTLRCSATPPESGLGRKTLVP